MHGVTIKMTWYLFRDCSGRGTRCHQNGAPDLSDKQPSEISTIEFTSYRISNGTACYPRPVLISVKFLNRFHLNKSHADTTVQIVPMMWVNDWVGHMLSMANPVTWLCVLFEVRCLIHWLPRQPLLAVCVPVRTPLFVRKLCAPDCIFSVRYAPLVQEPFCNWDPVHSMWGTGWGRRNSWVFRCNSTSS
jgi:hypothetical protein